MTHRERGSEVFEVTVGGELGPVFRHALRPCRVSEARLYTILVTTRADRTDVADLVRHLASCGVPVQDVIVHDPPEEPEGAR